MPVSPLSPDLLYRACDISQFEFATTAELKGQTGLAGQDRALEAIAFGIRMEKPGYNVFVLGPHGAGKREAVFQHLQTVVGQKPAPSDWAYVNNFADPYKPKVLELMAGRGRALHEGVTTLVEDLKGAIPAILESEEYKKRLANIDAQYADHQGQAFEALRIRAEANNVSVLSTPTGFAFAPNRDGEVMKPDAFNALPQEERERIKDVIGELEKSLADIFRNVPGWEKERREQVKRLNREVAENAVGDAIKDLAAMFQENPKVAEWLTALEDDLVTNIGYFSSDDREGDMAALVSGAVADPFHRYQVNVIVDNRPEPDGQPSENGDSEFIGGGAPIVVEEHPTFQNLSGRVEHMSQMGALVTDFTLIKAGSLHRANGGFLLIDALRLLREPMAWDALKRALRTNSLRLESAGDYLGLVSTVSLEPDPVPLNVKVILMGDRRLYYLLSEADPDFAELFKVAADFDDSLDRDADSDDLFANLLAELCRGEELLPLTASGVGRVIEASARFAEDAEKLSLVIDPIMDLVREADLYAREKAAPATDAQHVERALQARLDRNDRLREQSLESVTRDIVMIDTEGRVAGQVNGLTVLQLGQTRFGRPTRITARARMGSGTRLVDIEREVELGGPIHSKGVLILTGFLSSHFLPHKPLSLSATLVFEQSYGGVDGDSASAAELVALASALSEIPVHQNLAITGSINQLGDIQPIGGVNEKIEGFFDICARRGLTGDQGVLIPAANVKHLMLRQDIVDAVERGMFDVYPIETIEEAVELLLGTPAGLRDEFGAFPPGSVFAAVEARLDGFAERLKASSGPDAKGGAA